MADAADRAAMPGDTPTPAASASVFVVTFLAILGLIGVLLALDLFLARIDRRESDAHAAAEYDAGAGSLGAGEARAAVEHFGAAVAIDRSNGRYALALAQAQLADGRTAEAEATLQSLLERAGNDGPTNLTMAHAMVRARRQDEARSYYHRAIFGRWGADSIARRAAARFELIDLLDREGATRELLAELLPLEEASPDSVALRRRLGELFIRAGSPARGATIFRDVLRQDPRDADAYVGIGNAALALGNFRTARADFTEAARLRPDDARVAARLALADSVLAIDPGARGIGVRARYARSRALLARTVAALQRCGQPGAASGVRLDSAAALLGVVRPADEDVAGEQMVDLASALWAARPARCAGAAGAEALGIVHERLAR